LRPHQAGVAIDVGEDDVAAVQAHRVGGGKEGEAGTIVVVPGRGRGRGQQVKCGGAVGAGDGMGRAGCSARACSNRRRADRWSVSLCKAATTAGCPSSQ